MKKYIPLISISLIVCLFIYVFYRTEKTLINRVIISLFSRESYLDVKNYVAALVPMPDFLIYSLPEGLWVFCITLTSSFFYLELRTRRWSLVVFPLFLAIVMELFQFLHFTNGRFDLMDIGFAAGFWILGLFMTRTHWSRESIFQSFNSRAISCLFCYSIVYLAHVVY